jgi:hypothetical protein
MSDVWCSDCGHELTEVWPGGKWKHIDGYDYRGCPCVHYGEDCKP